jgi:uncharacterized protein (TIGR03067 family)
MKPGTFFCHARNLTMTKLLPLALLAVALAPAPEKTKTDKERIQGAWAVVGVEGEGKALKEGPIYDHVKDMKLTFTDDAVSNSNSPGDKGSFTLDPEKKPPTLDLVVKSADGQIQEKLLMLYELKDETLRLCASPMPNADRPKEFTSKGGQIILTLKREAKK